MTGVEMLVSAPIAAALFLYASLKIDQEHFLLKILFMFGFFGCLMLMGSAAVSEHCVFVETNNTKIQDVTTFVYGEQCYDHAHTSAELTFFKSTQLMTLLFGIYMICYIFWHWFKKTETFVRWFDKQP